MGGKKRLNLHPHRRPRIVRRLHFSDDRRVFASVSAKNIQRGINRIRVAGKQQSAAGLRVGQNGFLPVHNLRRQGDFIAEAFPIPRRRARGDSAFCQVNRVGDERNFGEVHLRRNSRGAAHFQQMPQQSEAGHIGHCAGAGKRRQFGAGFVQQGCLRQHLRIGVRRQDFFLQRRRQNSDSKRLSQNQGVAGARAAVCQNALRMRAPDDGKSVNRLGGGDGVSAGHRNSRGGAGVRAPFQDFRNLSGGQRRRHGDQRQGEKRSPAHRVNVRKRVGCRDFSEMLRNVRNRREKIRSGENGAFRGDFPNRRVVRIAGVYQQFGGGDSGADLRQHFAQNGGRNLAPASAPGGETG